MNDIVSFTSRAGSIAERLRESVALAPDQAALTVFDAAGERAYTHRTLDQRVRALAARLQQEFAAGTRMLLLLDNDEHYVVAFFACMYAGMTSVPAFPPESARDQHLGRLHAMARDCDAGAVLTTAAVAQWLSREAGVFSQARILAADELDLAWAEQWQAFTPDPASVAFLQYTSGSTSSPKGVMVTHANLMANEHAIHGAMATDPTDRFVSWLPLYHDMGLIGGLLQPFHIGCEVILTSPKYFLERPLRWLQAVSRFRATVSGGPDFAFRLCLERIRPEQLEGLDLSGWRVAFSGAEPVQPDTLAAFARLCAPAGFAAEALYPCYGLAEATLFVTGTPPGRGGRVRHFDEMALARAAVRPQEAGLALVSCGRPQPGSRLMIADTVTGDPVAPGVLGEIWTSGPSVAAGYWNNPQATREAFVDRDGERWLRSGDLGFMHEDELYVHGRLKDLIIVRGQNIYPQDVERVVEAEVAAVRKGRIAAFRVDGPQGEGIGLAVEVGRLQRKRHAAAEIVRALHRAVGMATGEALAVAVLLEPGALPKTSSGKLQRAATRKGWQDGSLSAYALWQHGAFEFGGESAALVEPPREGAETILASLWAEVLAAPVSDRRANFFEMGGNSLDAAQLLTRIRARLGVSLPLRALFTHAELADCAALIETQADATASVGLDDGPRADLAAPDGAAALASLSLAQQRLWLVDRLAPAARRSAYNLSAAYRLEGELDIARLERALAIVVSRHDSLRAAFVEDEQGNPRVRVRADAAVSLPLVDVAQAEVPACLERLAAAPFDLAQGAPLRAALLRVGPRDHVLALVVHHIVFDGWSQGVMLRELAAAYAGLALPSLPLQYGHYAAWTHARAATPAFRKSTDYWRERLAGAPALSTLPADRQVAAGTDATAGCLRVAIEPRLARRLQDLARRQGATLFQVLLAAFTLVLARHANQRDLVVGTDLAGRDHADLEPLIGFFVNVLPIRLHVPEAGPFTDWLALVRDTLLADHEHREVPFDRIVEAAGVPRERGRNPLAQVLFVMQNTPAWPLALPQLQVTTLPAPLPEAKFDLAVFVHEREDAFEVEWIHARARYQQATVAAVAEEWTSLLRQLGRQADLALSFRPEPLSKEAGMSMTPAPAANKQEKLKKFAARAPLAGAPAPRPLVRTSFLSSERQFPLVVQALDPTLDAVAWASAQRDQIEAWIAQHGGILFRDFAIASPQQFEAFAESVEPTLFGGYGDLPKKEGGRNTYRSTPYPEKQMILYHNESAHLDSWPRKQLFYCELPSRVGGATPIVDCREMLRRLPADLVAEFERKELLYVRTFTERFDVSWQSFFKTDARADVQARLDERGVAYRWLDDDTLQTRTRCPAVITHPVTGERVFFNQVQLHHLHCLEPEVREHIMETIGLERAPRHVTFGDGSPIPDAAMDLIGAAYEACAVRFDWRRGDVVMLDNMLAAHARDPYEEPRKVVVAMGAMFDRADLAPRAAGE